MPVQAAAATGFLPFITSLSLFLLCVQWLRTDEFSLTRSVRIYFTCLLGLSTETPPQRAIHGTHQQAKMLFVPCTEAHGQLPRIYAQYAMRWQRPAQLCMPLLRRQFAAVSVLQVVIAPLK